MNSLAHLPDPNMAYLHGQKAISSLSGPLVSPLGAIFWLLWVSQIGQTGQPRGPECAFNLVPTVFTKNHGKEAKLTYFIMFDPILAFFYSLF